jgi:hypothetical protein
MKTEVKEVEFKVPNKKDILKETATKIIEDFQNEHGEDWKLNCYEAIDNEIMKFQGSLEYWKGIRKLIK